MNTPKLDVVETKIAEGRVVLPREFFEAQIEYSTLVFELSLEALRRRLSLLKRIEIYFYNFFSKIAVKLCENPLKVQNALSNLYRLHSKGKLKGWVESEIPSYRSHLAELNELVYESQEIEKTV